MNACGRLGSGVSHLVEVDGVALDRFEPRVGFPFFERGNGLGEILLS